MRRRRLSSVVAIAAIGALCACGGSGSPSGAGAGGGSGAAGGTGAGAGAGSGSTGGFQVPGGGLLGGGGIGTGGGGSGLAPNAEVFATNALNDLIEVFDLRAGASVATLPVQGPTFITKDASAGRMLVTAAGDRSLVSLDITTRSQTGSVRLDTGEMTQYPAISFLDPLLAAVYVPTGALHMNGMTFVPGLVSTAVVVNNQKVRGIIDLDTSGLGTSPSLLTLLSTPVEGLGAYAAAQAGGLVYVTNLFSSTVTVIDPALVLNQAADPVVLTIPITGTAGGAALPTGIVADDQGKLYVPCFLSGDVAIIDPRNNHAVSYLAGVGVGPIAAAFRPGGGQGAVPFVYVANFFDGTVIEIDTTIGMVTNTFPVQNGSAFFAAMGLSPQQFQQMLQAAFQQLGIPAGGTTSAGNTANFMNALLGALSGGQSGQQAMGQVLMALIGQLLQSVMQQAGFNTQGGIGSAFTSVFQQVPLPGLTDVEVTRNGTLVAGSLFGVLPVYDPASNTGTAIPSNAAFQSAAAMPFAGLAAVAVHDR
ncbi:MAG: hypothetical protein KatS3mg102_2937 [Planctomycetota bacterium]|nr:MAG: hypothetical protein KatS3mg102_2937 [Planctomycetota bacterium]